MPKKSILLILASSLVMLGFSSMFFQFPIHITDMFNSEPVMLDLKAGDSYLADWQKVDSLESKGLPESALLIVNQIYHKAQQEKNQAQLMKSLVYKMKYNGQIHDDAIIMNVKMLNESLDSVGFPLKPLMHSMLAESYFNYFQENSWMFMSRSETVDFVDNDIRTWDLKKIVNEAARHYAASLESPDSLRRVRKSYFDDMLIKYEDTRIFRPSLYDLLAWRALDFYTNSSVSLEQPAYKFQIVGDDFFLEDAAFAKKDFPTKDSSSFLLAGVRVYQELTRQHLEDSDPSASVFVLRSRLAFGRENAISDIKDSLYLHALERALERNKKYAVSTFLAADIATEHLRRAASYDGTKSDDFKTERATALKYVSDANQFADYNGAILCTNIEKEIMSKDMQLSFEKVNVPNKPFLGSIRYQNVDKIYLRAIKATDVIKAYLQDYERSDRYTRLTKEPFVTSWDFNIPADKDYNPHSLQFPSPALPVGEYIILASSSKDFLTENHGLAMSGLHVSNIAYSSRRLPSGSFEYIVTDRETGAPLVGLEAQALEREYDYDSRKYKRKLTQKATSDKMGMFVIEGANERYQDFSIEMRYKNDFLNTEDRWYTYRYRDVEPRQQEKTFFFTDRSIYRPGQTVYFKGIKILTDGKSSTILKGSSTEVTFHDANSQELAKLSLKTNEFGSFQGTFTAPQGQLNGAMTIMNNSGSVGFSVEDYKRPKFEVNFEPVAGSFKLGDKVKAKGKAVAYAGSNIDGAEVKYRVVRNASFPWWGYWCWWRPMPQVSPMEIAYGVATTNEKGEFEIEFEAIPDRSISPTMKPQFAYKVMVDVVDITGETHSSSTSVQVGYLAMSANVAIPGNVNKPEAKKFKINAFNLNFQPEPAAGTITIHQLKQPQFAYKTRLWAQPDKFLLSESQFRQQFPYDLYKSEDDQKSWEKGKEVLKQSFDTEKDDSVDFKQCKGWEQGQYVLELLSKDKFGAEVKSIQYFTVTGPDEKGIPTNAVLWTQLGGGNYEPGQTAKLTMGTASPTTWMLYEVEHQGKIVKREWIQLSESKTNLSIAITEAHRGNLSVHCFASKYGRMSTASQTLMVPWTNKQLDITYATFRDKMQPGSKEEWTVKITGPNGEKVAAELLTGMYDASLDAFRANSWSMLLNPSYYSNLYWAGNMSYTVTNSQIISNYWNPELKYYNEAFDQIDWFGYAFSSLGSMYNYAWGVNEESEFDDDSFGERDQLQTFQYASPKPSPAPKAMMNRTEGVDMVAAATTGAKLDAGGAKDDIVIGDKLTEASLGEVQVRTNLNETAFFFPQLATDTEGNVIFKFTMPEALTRWRFMTLAHTADLKVGYREGTAVTQKELMVMPNAPRFFREGDEIIYMAKVSNLNDKDLSGQASLDLFDELTMSPIDVALGNTQKTQSFNVKKGESVAMSWKLKIPAGIQAVTHRVKAVAGSFSDGEESTLPVLTNSMLVTEAMPLPVRPLQTKTFSFDRLIQNKSTTLRNHKLTLEFTSNPAWYAVQALPYMMEYPYECVEQTFSRYYANSIAAHIANKHPKIKQVFDQWKSAGKEALLSNLEKNQELKYLLLEETPWVINAQDETQRKQSVGLLFDLNRMADEMERAKQKVIKAQASNGGFTWFPGMPESRYMTQHIVTGFGHLDHLGVTSVRTDKETWNMVRLAVLYLDARIKDDYDWLLSHKVDLKQRQIGWDHVQYLYARSYFKDVPIRSGCETAVNYYGEQAKKYWTEFNKYNQGMIALALHRNEDKSTPMAIIKSLKEFSQKNEELGMYWKASGSGLYWYEAPIETQALLIEAFDEVANDQVSVEEMKLWLLKQKQTQDWKTTKATAEACYALLLRGADYLAESKLADITIGSNHLDPLSDPTLKVEAGTGYFKTSWSGSDITPEMGKVVVKNNNKVAAWGAVYWQYFEQLDKITFADNKLSIQKELFLEENTPTGPKITPIAKGRVLKPGDKIKVRIVLESDRDMEYVHMKDMRAAGFEPINVISRYKYQDGLGYYETTRDAATNFFFDWLPKGKHVFEYPLRVTHRGDFSNGITTVQCMYAPEFTSHSQGVRVKVD